MKWISVKERLPLNESDVLCFLSNGMIVISYYYKDEADLGWWWEYTNVRIDNKVKVTHWAELPKPPKGK